MLFKIWPFNFRSNLSKWQEMSDENKKLKEKTNSEKSLAARRKDENGNKVSWLMLIIHAVLTVHKNPKETGNEWGMFIDFYINVISK